MKERTLSDLAAIGHYAAVRQTYAVTAEASALWHGVHQSVVAAEQDRVGWDAEYRLRDRCRELSRRVNR